MGAVPLGGAWRHPVPAVVEYAAGEERVVVDAGVVAGLSSAGKRVLNRIEQVTLQNGLVLARKMQSLMDDLTDVDAVLQEVGEGAFRERDTTSRPAVPKAG